MSGVTTSQIIKFNVLRRLDKPCIALSCVFNQILSGQNYRHSQISAVSDLMRFIILSYFPPLQYYILSNLDLGGFCFRGFFMFTIPVRNSLKKQSCETPVFLYVGMCLVNLLHKSQTEAVADMRMVGLHIFTTYLPGLYHISILNLDTQFCYRRPLLVHSHLRMCAALKKVLFQKINK